MKRSTSFTGDDISSPALSPVSDGDGDVPFSSPSLCSCILAKVGCQFTSRIVFSEVRFLLAGRHESKVACIHQWRNTS